LAAAKLSARHKKFCEEYLKDLNATQAYIRVGYSKNGADVSACQLLRNPKVKAYIEEKLAKQSERLEVDADWVVKKWIELIDICMSAVPVMVKRGNKLVESGEYKIDSYGANKALENMAKHFNMFQEDNKGKGIDLDFNFTLGDQHMKPFVPDSKSRLKARDN
jgi:phage terminase small subunit